MLGEWTETDRQPATLNYEISTVWEMKPRTTPEETSGLLIGPEKVTGDKTLQDFWPIRFVNFSRF
jgi:hypothetical protein